MPSIYNYLQSLFLKNREYIVPLEKIRAGPIIHSAFLASLDETSTNVKWQFLHLATLQYNDS